MTGQIPEILLILWISLILDLFGRELPNRFHPTAWMGRYLIWTERKETGESPLIQFGFGALVILLGATLVGSTIFLLEHWIRRLPSLLSVLSQAILLKLSYSLRGLVEAVLEVKNALQRGDLPSARRSLAYHLVSRDTSDLAEYEVAGASIESLAENLTDSFVAPLLYYLFFGLPGAYLYRFVNTADAILGYRDPRHEYLGKFAARCDDVLNWFPARISALFLILGALLAREDARGGVRIMLRDHSKTQSPNAGWTMSAMAGALGVELSKRNHYILGEGLAHPGTDTIVRALRIFGFTSALLVLFSSLLWLGGLWD